MKATKLINKLTKMNISHEVINHNDWNFEIRFIMGGKVFEASYSANSNNISSFSRESYYCNSDQAMKYRFFDNFNQCLRSIN